eukprot:Pgem_evm1s13017
MLFLAVLLFDLSSKNEIFVSIFLVPLECIVKHTPVSIEKFQTIPDTNKQLHTDKGTFNPLFSNGEGNNHVYIIRRTGKTPGACSLLEVKASRRINESDFKKKVQELRELFQSKMDSWFLDQAPLLTEERKVKLASEFERIFTNIRDSNNNDTDITNQD